MFRVKRGQGDVTTGFHAGLDTALGFQESIDEEKY